MAKRTMTRAAAENVYLHKDFHGALSAAISYLHQRYGAEAAREYLRRFAAAYYAPLTAGVDRLGEGRVIGGGEPAQVFARRLLRAPHRGDQRPRSARPARAPGTHLCHRRAGDQYDWHG